MRTLLLIALIAGPAPAMAGSKKPAKKRPSPAWFAKEAYKTTIGAFNRQNKEIYAAGFAPSLDCFYDKRAYPRKKYLASQMRGWTRGWPRHVKPDGEFESPSLEIWQIVQAHMTPRLVAFVDYGRWGGADLETFGTHTKYIVMRKTAGRWRVAAEFDKGNKKCPHHKRFAKVKPPKRFAKCDKALADEFGSKLWSSCKNRDFASNGCQMLQSGLNQGLNRCWATGKFDTASE